jgi:2-polyprenyl-3-methyl-5-hydroxy-6-metoxy-1,4-benzoquinol methylase
MKLNEIKKQLPKLELMVQAAINKQSFCPHCGSHNLSEIQRKYLLVKITKCSDCNLYFTDPIYESFLADNLYNSLYEAEGSTTHCPNDRELEKLKENKFYSSDKFFGTRLQAIKSICEGENLLELGSSWGYFLYQAQQYGFKATGIEISEPRRLFGIDKLGVNIVKSPAQLQDLLFDLVYTSHVLEHFVDLSTIFVQINHLLKLTGKLIIEVPNFDFEAFGSQCLSTIGAIHPLGFSSEFFSKNLPKYGFRVISFYDSWESFPNIKVTKSSEGVVILFAEKIAECS